MSGPEKRNYGMSMERGSSVPSHVAPGTACAPCTAKGHFCAAYEIIGGRAVCLHCLDGVPCMRASRVGGVPQSPAAVLTSGHQLSGKEHEEVRLHYRAGKSLEWIAGQYGLSLIRMTEIAKGFPVPQPALAAGAIASPNMPARRHFGHKTAAQRPWASKAVARDRAKAMLAKGRSMTEAMKATGLSKSTMARVRLELPGLAPARKGGRPAHAPKFEKVTVTTKLVEKVCEMSNEEQREQSSKLSELGYSVISLAELPGRRYQGVYDEVVDELMKLPKLSVLTKKYNNDKIADTFLSGIVRVARRRGMKMKQKQDGCTIYVWQA